MSMAPNMPRRVPKRAMITDASESPTMDATPIPSSSRPIWLFSIPSAILMSGTRDAHVAMLRPLARKIAKTAVRQRTYCARVRG